MKIIEISKETQKLRKKYEKRLERLSRDLMRDAFKFMQDKKVKLSSKMDKGYTLSTEAHVILAVLRGKIRDTLDLDMAIEQQRQFCNIIKIKEHLK